MSQFKNAIEKPLENLYDYIEANCVNPSAAFFIANDSLEKVTNGD
jgi:predicted DNA-binding protein